MSKEKTAPGAPAKAALDLDPKYIGRITGTLLVICLAVALLLGILITVAEPDLQVSTPSPSPGSTPSRRRRLRPPWPRCFRRTGMRRWRRRGTT